MHFPTAALFTATLMASNAFAGWFAFYHDNNYQLVVKDGNPNCKGQCMTFTNTATSAKLYGSGGKFTSCSVYRNNQCSGEYVTLYSDKNKNEKKYQLSEGYGSAKCYFGC
ncbi:hypothetical protein ABW19_dt0202175 [Dactylella cylindrospora]|nr:hypothetical protein ABW19_dt0202175 [Dactylella cylindrospora]